MRANSFSTTQERTAVIAAGNSLSSGVKLGGMPLVGIEVDGDWAAAQVTFQYSRDGGTTWFDVKDDGVEYVVAALTGPDASAVDFRLFLGYDLIRVRSGTAGAPVAQAAGTTVTLLGRKM